MKRITAVILSTIMLLSALLFAFPAQSAELVQLGSSDTYYLYDEETATLTITGTGAIPNFSNQSNVPWKDERGDINHIVVEEGITAIGNYTFYSFNSCTDISLPSTITAIGKNAFARCAFEEIILPDGLTSIDNYAFYMSAVRSVKIPQSVTSIGRYAFMLCENLERFELSFGAECTVNSSALSGCTSLKKIIVPSGITLSAHSFGYNSGNSALIRDDLIIYGYPSTSAQTYALSNNIEFIDLEECIIPIYEGLTLGGEIYTNGSFTKFQFTPEVTAEYKFYSSGSVDTEGYLYNENGKQIGYGDDIAETNRNFCLSHILEAGHTYYITVCGYKDNSSGAFMLSLMPVNVESISAAFSPSVSFVEYVEADFTDGSYYYDYSNSLENLNVTLVYDTGYTVCVSAASGIYDDIAINVYDNQSVETWSLGNNDVMVEYGGLTCSAYVTLTEHTHSYDSTIIEPDLENGGYTLYKCVWCGSSYMSDYTERLGREVNGSVVLMEAPDGSCSSQIPIANANIYIDGKFAATTNENGEYGILLEKGEYELLICPPYGADVSTEITVNDNMTVDSIAVIGFDFNHDGFINYRDYNALLIYGKNGVITDADYNGDGKIDADDLEFADGFLNTSVKSIHF